MDKNFMNLIFIASYQLVSVNISFPHLTDCHMLSFHQIKIRHIYKYNKWWPVLKY